MTLPIRAFDWSSLEATLAQILDHRDLVREVSGIGTTALDALAADLGRVRRMLAVLGDRCNEAGSTSVRTLLVRVYHFAIEIGSHLTDLEVAALDRAPSTDEAESFARHATTSFVGAVDVAFDEALDTLPYGRGAALAWDLETLRVAVERIVLDAYAIEATRDCVPSRQ